VSQKSLVMIWVAAARLRTLPLSVAGIVVGNAFAIQNEGFCPYVFGGTLLTAIVFQILSNFANDYGDGIKGTDNHERIGPKRVLQQNLLSPKILLRGIIITAVVGFLLAAATVAVAFEADETKSVFTFLGLAVVAIVAAYKYTAGKGAYGYHALGDVFVFAFFGLLAVGGSFYLQTKQLDPNIWWFAFAIGGLSTAVLNLNNMRDMQNDTKAGKKTVAAFLGLKNAKTYHSILVLGSITTLTIGLLLTTNEWIGYIPLLMVFPLLLQLKSTLKLNVHSGFDALLKPLALSIFGISMLLLLTQIIGS
jgi:1,4-dihydroxy-2-naphthoate octaprenyltransferase